jgi:DNA-binding transcriptional ArsR family regulator
MPSAANPFDAAAANPFDALGDPTRRAILELLGRGDRSVREVAEALPVSRPAVSKHLRLLKAARLVDEERRGTRSIYHLREEGLDAVREYLERLWGDAATRYRLLADNAER